MQNLQDNGDRFSGGNDLVWKEKGIGVIGGQERDVPKDGENVEDPEREGGRRPFFDWSNDE